MGTPWHKKDAAHHPAPSRAMAIGLRAIREIHDKFFRFAGQKSELDGGGCLETTGGVANRCSRTTGAPTRLIAKQQ
jgi:hypothetical protein